MARGRRPGESWSFRTPNPPAAPRPPSTSIDDSHVWTSWPFTQRSRTPGSGASSQSCARGRSGLRSLLACGLTGGHRRCGLVFEWVTLALHPGRECERVGRPGDAAASPRLGSWGTATSARGATALSPLRRGPHGQPGGFALDYPCRNWPLAVPSTLDLAESGYSFRTRLAARRCAGWKATVAARAVPTSGSRRANSRIGKAYTVPPPVARTEGANSHRPGAAAAAAVRNACALGHDQTRRSASVRHVLGASVARSGAHIQPVCTHLS
jgi:hypothetical protein